MAASSPVSAQSIPSLDTDLGPVQPFSLTERSGKTFRPKDLRGKVWVAHFFFTTCLGDCSKTTATMSRYQGLFKGSPDVAFVSITVNPEDDTAERLKRYADDHWAEPDQWFFLTGEPGEVRRVVMEVFQQPIDRVQDAKPGFEVNHSFRLVVVDREGIMRGYIDGRDPDAVNQLEAKIRSLANRRYLLPAVNAALNGLCFVLLIVGYIAIKLKQERLHKAVMVAALLTSALFLSCYLYYHFAVLNGKPTGFRGEGMIRPIYFAILLSHTILAAVVAPLALYVAWQGWRDRRPRHVRLARWALPLWLYVSLTGVLVYFLLYVVYPPV